MANLTRDLTGVCSKGRGHSGDQTTPFANWASTTPVDVIFDIMRMQPLTLQPMCWGVWDYFNDAGKVSG